MYTIRQALKSMSAALLSVVFVGVNPAFGEGVVPDHAPHHRSAVHEWIGVYNGFLPCDDCPGVKTSLALNPNNTYMWVTQFVTKSDREFVEKGRYTWDEQTKTIELTPRKSELKHQFLMGDKRLTQLDDNGKLITGKLAERYVFRKFESTGPSDQSSHQGH